MISKTKAHKNLSQQQKQEEKIYVKYVKVHYQNIHVQNVNKEHVV